mgnify:CR=1 FL=1|tara:strand:+ start:874 stop:1398 length:525 start_codon:yes stop_codon:yes gene_type:complete
MEYTSSFDFRTGLITVIVVLVLLGVILYALIKHHNFGLQVGKTGSGLDRIVSWFCLITLVGVSALVYNFTMIKYTVKDQQLSVIRPPFLEDIVIKKSDIVEVKTLETEGFVIRKSWGNEGVFGYFGNFRNTLLGDFEFYARNSKNLILITTIEGRRIVISPDGDEMIENLRLEN